MLILLHVRQKALQLKNKGVSIMKFRNITLIISLVFSLSLLTSCLSEKPSSQEESSSEGITISDELADVHGTVTKVIDDNTVILKITKSGFDKSHENNSFKIKYVGGTETDGTPYLFKVEDNAYFQTISGGELTEDDNGEKYWNIISLIKE